MISIKEKSILTKFQNYIAHISIGPSTLRGHKKGTMKNVINSLKEIPLNKLSKINNEEKFIEWLNKQTEKLVCKLPGKSWGTARKTINVFLFHACHNVWLARNYQLRKIIPYLELTLDNYNAKKLKKYAEKEGIELKWKSIKCLTAEENEKFQKYARKYAKERYNLERCYLDVIFWPEGREKR